MAGKGDWKRPTDEKKVSTNWDKIKWKSDEKKNSAGNDNKDTANR